VTLRAGRSEAVGQENYNRWDLRQELEYGVTDLVHGSPLSKRAGGELPDSATGANKSEFEWNGFRWRTGSTF